MPVATDTATLLNFLVTTDADLLNLVDTVAEEIQALRQGLTEPDDVHVASVAADLATAAQQLINAFGHRR